MGPQQTQPEANPFDKAARYAARQLDAAGFLRWLLPEVFRGWHWEGWLDTRGVPFPGEPERQSDTVAAFSRLAADAPPAAAVIEFQSRPRGDMAERVAEYALRLRREVPYQWEPRVPYDVVGVVLNLTGPAQPEAWAMAPPDFAGLGLWSRARVCTLRELDAAATLADIAGGEASLCVLPWVALMRGADQPPVIEEWRRLASQEPDVRRRGDYGGLARVFAELAGRREVWKAGLEGWNVEVSQVVQEWQAQALERGRAEGEAKGRAEGEARMATSLRAKLLRVVQVRWGVEPPPDLAAAVQAQENPETLDRWFDLVLAANTLDEAQAAIRGS